MKFWLLLATSSVAISALVIFGSAQRQNPAPPADPNREYQYPGTGRRPSFVADEKQLVEWVNVNRNTGTAIGRPLNGPCWELQTYDTGRVGFADGTVKTFAPITLV